MRFVFNIFIIVLFFFSSYAYAFNEQPFLSETQKAEIINKGIQEFKKLYDVNEAAKKMGQKTNFVLTINSESKDYIKQTEVASQNSFISSQFEETLNNRLNGIYASTGIDCYIILINAFDLKIEAQVPDGSTVNELFNGGKFFNENSNIQTLTTQHNEIAQKITNSIFSATSSNFYVIVNGRYIATMHNQTQKDYFLYNIKRTNLPNKPNNFLEAYSFFKESIKHNPSFGDIRTRDSVPSIEVTDLERSIKNVQNKALILSTYTSEGISTILKDFTSADYYTLTVQERLHCLSVYIGYEMEENLTVFGNNEEGYALKLLKHIKEELIGLFQGLEGQSVLKNNSLYNGQKDNKVIIVKLINRMHDGLGPYEDNYSKMISILIEHITKSSELLDKYIVDMSGEDFLEVKYYSTDAIPSTTEAGTINYDVTLNDDGTMKIEREMAYKEIMIEGDCACFGDDCCMKTYWEQWSDLNGVRPFEMILFTNYSKLSMIEENIVESKEEILAPAIVMKYCDDKDFNNVSVERVSIAMDVLALATGLGEVKVAIDARKYARALYEVAQIFSSSANLAVNSSTDTDIQELKQKYDEIMLVWDISNILNGTGKMLNRTYHAVKSGTSKRLTRIKANEFLSKYESTKQAGKQIPENIKKLAIYMKSKLGTLVGNVSGAGSNIFSTLKTEITILSKQVKSHTVLEAEYLTKYPGSTNYPYLTTAPVEDIVISTNTKFVRFHDANNINREWMMSIDDFNAHIADGGTLDDIVEKLALPTKPTKISLVEIPANKTIRKSVAGPQQWPNIPYQNGGYTQYQILGYSQSNQIPIQWYSQTTDLNTFFK